MCILSLLYVCSLARSPKSLSWFETGQFYGSAGGQWCCCWYRAMFCFLYLIFYSAVNVQPSRRMKREPCGGTIADQLPVIRPRDAPFPGVAKMSKTLHDTVPPALAPLLVLVLFRPSQLRLICENCSSTAWLPEDAVTLSSHGDCTLSLRKHPTQGPSDEVLSLQCGGNGVTASPTAIPALLKRTTATALAGEVSGFAQSSCCVGPDQIRPPAYAAASLYCWSTCSMSLFSSKSINRCCILPGRGSFLRAREAAGSADAPNQASSSSTSVNRRYIYIYIYIYEDVVRVAFTACIAHGAHALPCHHSFISLHHSARVCGARQHNARTCMCALRTHTKSQHTRAGAHERTRPHAHIRTHARTHTHIHTHTNTHTLTHSLSPSFSHPLSHTHGTYVRTR